MAVVQPHDVTFILDWDAVSKRWKLTWRARSGKGWAHHWKWIDSHVPIDATAAARMARLLSADLESRLF